MKVHKSHFNENVSNIYWASTVSTLNSHLNFSNQILFHHSLPSVTALRQSDLRNRNGPSFLYGLSTCSAHQTYLGNVFYHNNNKRFDCCLVLKTQCILLNFSQITVQKLLLKICMITLQREGWYSIVVVVWL